MSVDSPDPGVAFRVADSIRRKVGAPWDVYGERVRRFEIHLNGRTAEMVRGPIVMEGFGLRVLRPREAELGVGFGATSDTSDKGILATCEDAETSARLAKFPAKSVDLPSGPSGGGASVEAVDVDLWSAPEQLLERFVADLVSAFDGHTNEVPSFGSVRASLSEWSLANSSGLERSSRRTLVDFELAVKATGGPEGRPPGEYWVNRRSARLQGQGIREEVAGWCRRAQDVRRAVPPPTGEQTVVFPPETLADVVPVILGFRFSGGAKLVNLAPAPGSTVGSSLLNVWDDGRFPYGLSTALFDDEGVPQTKRPLIEQGVARPPMLDVLHASALGGEPTGNGRRDLAEYAPWFHFALPPTPQSTTLVIGRGSGGTDEEIAEAVGEGIWLDQLGYAFPDSFSGAFGGEIRIGYRIRGGRIQEPVRGGVVGSVLLGGEGSPTFLNSVKFVGGNPVHVGALVSPALAVERVPVSGS